MLEVPEGKKRISILTSTQVIDHEGKIKLKMFCLLGLVECPHMTLKCNHNVSGCEQQRRYNHWTPLKTESNTTA